MQKRTFIQAVAVAWGTSGRLANSQTSTPWPTKPVRLIVPFPAGAGIDTAARSLGDQLQGGWGTQPVIVDNKPGGGTIIGVNSLLGLPRDGHSFLVTIISTFLLPHLGQKVPFDPMVDLVPVGAVAMDQLVVVASPKLGARTFTDMVARVGRNPTGAEFGTFGQGSYAHILASQIAREKKLDLVIAHYKGTAPLAQALLTGEIGMAAGNLGTFQPFIATGKLVALAVPGATRARSLPDVPTLQEVGISGLNTPAWIGVFAAGGTPADAIRKMASDMRTALQKSALVEKMHRYFQEPGSMSVEEFSSLVRTDVESRAALIKAHGIRLE